MYMLCFKAVTLYCHAYSCTPCQCEPLAKTVTCLGHNVTSLPPIPKWAAHVAILRTSIDNLEELRDVTGIKSLNLRANSKIPCSEVMNFTSIRRDIILDTDCFNVTVTENTLSSDSYIFPLETICSLGQLGILVPVIYLVLKFKRYMERNAFNDSGEDANV